VDMSEEDAGETGGDREGERSGVVKGDDGWEVNGDERGSVSRGGRFNLWDLVRGASVGVCGFCNSEGQLPVVYFVDDVMSGRLKVICSVSSPVVS
jgi:hypothetical protein